MLQLASSRFAIPEDTELITLDIQQDNPRLIALPDVSSTCPQAQESLHLGLLIVRSEVGMNPVLPRLLLVSGYEHHSGGGRRNRPDLELLISVDRHDPPQGVAPPLSERPGIQRRDDYLLPHQCHPVTVPRSPHRRAASTSWPHPSSPVVAPRWSRASLRSRAIPSRAVTAGWVRSSACSRHSGADDVLLLDCQIGCGESGFDRGLDRINPDPGDVAVLNQTDHMGGVAAAGCTPGPTARGDLRHRCDPYRLQTWFG